MVAAADRMDGGRRGLVGLADGLFTLSPNRMHNGLIGGLAGGLIGGTAVRPDQGAGGP